MKKSNHKCEESMYGYCYECGKDMCMQKKTISVPVSWFEQLLKLSKRAQSDSERWYLGEKPLMPTSISSLIGYSSSAESIIKHK